MEFLFFSILIATSVFLVNQFYLALRKGELTVRTGVYNRRRTPILYWAAMFTLLSGTLSLFLISAACAAFYFAM